MLDIATKPKALVPESSSWKKLPIDKLIDKTMSNHTPKVVQITNLLSRMGELFGMGQGYGANRALDGYLCAAQHSVETEEVCRWNNMLVRAHTVRDVWDFFLKENDIPKYEIVKVPDYDHVRFEQMLTTALHSFKTVNFVVFDDVNSYH